MEKLFFRSILIVFAVMTLLLGACGDSDETKSQHLLSQAEALMQQGKGSQAEQVLTDLLAKYSKTQSGDDARKHLQRIQKERELLESNKKIAKALSSYRQVLDGYHALYAEYPRSVAALDQSDYFFDSTYLKEVTPDGYKAYLWLNSDGSHYRVWCVSLEKGNGFVVENQNRKLIPIEHGKSLEKFKTSFLAMTWDDKLVALLEKE